MVGRGLSDMDRANDLRRGVVTMKLSREIEPMTGGIETKTREARNGSRSQELALRSANLLSKRSHQHRLHPVNEAVQKIGKIEYRASTDHASIGLD